jgi:hypothetical protein
MISFMYIRKIIRQDLELQWGEIHTEGTEENYLRVNESDLAYALPEFPFKLDNAELTPHRMLLIVGNNIVSMIIMTVIINIWLQMFRAS